jgi:uncharacterized membrane protein
MKIFFISWFISALLFVSYSSHYKLFGFKTLAKTTGGFIALCSLGIFLFSIRCLMYKEAMIYSLIS